MKRVLIVDDSVTIRQQVRLALCQEGFDVVEAADGAEGVRMIREDADIRAVLCDVHMPVKNGLELVEEIRGNGGVYAKLPIVMLTTDADRELIQRAKKAGANAWIVKPFRPNLLVSALQKLTA